MLQPLYLSLYSGLVRAVVAGAGGVRVCVHTYVHTVLAALCATRTGGTAISNSQ